MSFATGVWDTCMHFNASPRTRCLLLLLAAVKGAGLMRLGPAACTELKCTRDACCKHDMLFDVGWRSMHAAVAQIVEQQG
jgi:hypothetical protein